MRHGSLFSGIGGFDLAAHWAGWENIFHCEWNTFGQRVLKYYWPNAITYNDIKLTDFTIHRGTIDILSGGFPCQPYSVAGKRLGKEDDRHLWPEMLRAIREIQPSYVVGENVRGLTNWNGGLVFDEVQADLENEGYEVTPFLLPACAVNAPHRRDRIWFIAYSDSNSRRTTKGNFNEERQYLQCRASRFSLQWLTPYSYGVQRNPERKKRKHSRSRRNARCYFSGISFKGDATNSTSERLERTNGRQQASRNITGLRSENWEQWPTESPICNGDDGLSSRLDGITFPKWRSESIKAGGNAIVTTSSLSDF